MRLVLREEDLAQHLEAMLPEEATPVKRAAVESTRMFGTGDDKALAAAVTFLAPDPSATSRAGSLPGNLAPGFKQFVAVLKSLQSAVKFA
jgi:hypothetical protein